MQAPDRERGVNAVDELIELERRIGGIIEVTTTVSLHDVHPGLPSLLEGLRATSQHQREALETQRQRPGAKAPSARILPTARSLGAVYAALNEIALAYVVLHAKAHRAFDSEGNAEVAGSTAALAESHLRAYTGAIQQLSVLISDIAVNELGSAGEDCACQCPACSLGLCLCAPHGMNTVRQVWQGMIPPPPEGGLRVRRPRAGSEAKRAGLVDGDRVLAIDGHEIQTDLDTETVQAAIRAHGAGDAVRMRVLRAGSEPIELTLRRA